MYSADRGEFMNKTTKIITIVVAALLIVGLTIGVIIADNERNKLEIQLQAVYQRSMQQLNTELESLITKLDKLEAANSTGQRNILLMDVWRQTGNIENSISEMPVAYKNTSTLTQFINRTGDYCYTLCQKLASGENISDEDINQIKQLADSCEEIKTALGDQNNEFMLNSDSFFADDDTNLDFTNQQYARLQYDGPFSESTEDKQPKGLGDQNVDVEAAKKAAADFIGMNAEELQTAEDLNGTIECYGFTGTLEESPFKIYITKIGGKVLWYMHERTGGISAVPTNSKYVELTKVAKEYLKEKGYGETAPSYAQFYDGMAVINLAPVENNITLYPDLVKVWVDISAKKVMGMDANNYLMSHTDRSLSEPLLTKEEAIEHLTQGMKIRKTRLALIPLDNNTEVLCYEFTGTVEEKDFIVYINAENGREEDILMIQHTNEGTLVM